MGEGADMHKSETIWAELEPMFEHLATIQAAAQSPRLHEVLQAMAPGAMIVDALENDGHFSDTNTLLEYRRRTGLGEPTLELLATSVTDDGPAIGAAMAINGKTTVALWVREGHFLSFMSPDDTFRSGLHLVIDDPQSDSRPGPCLLGRLQASRAPAIDHLPELLGGAALVAPNGYTRRIDATVLTALTIGQAFSAATRNGPLMVPPHNEHPLAFTIANQLQAGFPPLVVAGTSAWAETHASRLLTEAVEEVRDDRP